MSQGPVCVFGAVITSGTSGPGNIDLSTKAWSSVHVEFPTFSTGTEIYVYGSSDGTTYRPLFERVNTASVQYVSIVTFPTTNSNSIAPLTVWTRYLQVRTSQTVNNGATVNFICRD